MKLKERRGKIHKQSWQPENMQVKKKGNIAAVYLQAFHEGTALRYYRSGVYFRLTSTLDYRQTL